MATAAAAATTDAAMNPMGRRSRLRARLRRLLVPPRTPRRWSAPRPPCPGARDLQALLAVCAAIPPLAGAERWSSSRCSRSSRRRRSGCSSSSSTRCSCRTTSGHSSGSRAPTSASRCSPASLGFLDDYLATWVGERFLLDLRTRFFRHLQGLSLDFFDRRRLGDLISRLTGDIASIESFVLSGVTDAISYALRIVFFAPRSSICSGTSRCLAGGRAALLAGARRFSRLIKLASREKRRRSGSISSVAEESLSNAALVQAYDRQDGRGRALPPREPRQLSRRRWPRRGCRRSTRR